MRARGSTTRGPAVARRAATAAIAMVVVSGPVLAAEAGPSASPVSFGGPEPGAVLGAELLEDLAFTVTPTDAADEATGGAAGPAFDEMQVELNGEDVSASAEYDSHGLRYAPGELDDGAHEVALTVNSGGSETSESWEFTVDTTPPSLEITDPADGMLADGEPAADDEPAADAAAAESGAPVISGQTDPGAAVTVDGAPAQVDGDGAFELALDAVPAEPLAVRAQDAAGNASVEEVTLVTAPSRVEVDAMRSAHVTASALASESLRDNLDEMITDGLINSVALTIKGEGGGVDWDLDVPLAAESGAKGLNHLTLDLAETVEELHDQRVHVAGRIVAFRDGTLGEHAQELDESDWLIQTTGGEPYTRTYGCCFINFANEDVIDYHLDLAEAAASAGVDDILWDYIRRPDGDPEQMVFPGLDDDDDAETLEEAIVSFTAAADDRLAPYGIDHGASLYGIAVDRPTQIAQDVPGMAEHLDYVAPMIYPSHWGAGEYGVDDPVRQPYDIITETLELWGEALDGSRARLVPWLEDTAFRAWDRPEQVREQIAATADQGIDEFIMWDPQARYTPEAYQSQS